jgi:hypothetical protein
MFRSATLALVPRLLAFTVLITGFAFIASAQPGPPRVSPQAKLSQPIGSSTLELVYGRPSVRGRTIWGELEAWDKVWRTGANEATTFSISHDATIGGQPLAAGTYALFTIPRADRWSVIFNKVAEQWGAFSHDPAQDVLVVEVKPRTVPLHETLQFSVPAVAADRATVELAWERTAISFEVAFDANATALSKAKAEVAEAGDASRVAYGWARHFQTQGTHLEVALGWASASAKAADHYWTQSVRARILADLGRVEQAKEAAQHALTVIEAAPNPEFAKRDGAKLKEEMAGW